ncbi:hypothetical protein [Aestuariirhabdus sp. LZHN29]|uniref:hypothetical protein n=1 Tax=Aestuariirhabdus sp. LZHN29 TaxID=3417462 RepID=UPI003CE7B7BD
MSRNYLIHTLFFMIYAGLNVGVYQLSSQFGFSPVGQFVLAPLIIIAGGSLLYVMDERLVAALCSVGNREAVADSAARVAVGETLVEAVAVQSPAMVERRVNPRRVLPGRSERRRALFPGQMAVTS